MSGLLKEKDVETIRLDVVCEFLERWFGPSFNTPEVLTGFAFVEIFNISIEFYLSGS